MGAGKTFLMAAFILLDLYFARIDPANPAFAHNFIVLVPSGLKSSILPSLKTIEHFDPTWILPEPAAGEIKKLIRFEMLDQPKSAKKSNKARNPNAQKIGQHQPFDDLMGLIMVTNAEKVILDSVRLDAQQKLIEETDDEKDKTANELRNLIGKIPHLQILIDEVHHAAEGDIKLRQVVNRWSAGGNINGVLGFSGTPYLNKPEKIELASGASISFPQITSTVFYYPLKRAVETFLKKPTIQTVTKIAPNEIVREGVKEFQARYGSKIYADGTTAKLAIYCASIERLEREIYPLLRELGFPDDDILKFHKGNPQYPQPRDSEAQFRILDTTLSTKRVVLLVGIGKEGWDCRSLTGVILSQKGDCPVNMVLQTGCRCLRQVPGEEDATAGVWLNEDNAKILEKQLKEEQNTSIAELNALGSKSGAAAMRPRFARVDALKLPQVLFYQLRVKYDTLIAEPATPQTVLPAIAPADFRTTGESITSDLLSGEALNRRLIETSAGETADFAEWKIGLIKTSFGGLDWKKLAPFEAELRRIFDAITYEDAAGILRFNALYEADALAACVRLAFCEQRTLSSTADTIGTDAHLLIVSKLEEIPAAKTNLYPSEADCELIRDLDTNGQTAEQYAETKQQEYAAALEVLRAQNINVNLLNQPDTRLPVAVTQKERTLHYAPYAFDSGFESKVMQEALTLEALRERGLELYFNGAGELTEFRIDCYAKTAHGWSKVGKYTPDFLLVERKNGEIYRALIIETKGSGFAEQSAFKARRKFVQEEFLPLNNDKFGYRRFDYLYLSDSDADYLPKLCAAAQAFFVME